MEALPAPSISLFGYIIPFLIVLTIVVFFHELGHFLVARWNKVKVDAFSVGFGPELLGFTDRYGTRWKLSAVPLGGYVKFHGDADAASTPDHEAAAAMSAEERKVSFVHKKIWQRAAVVAAGPIANFILAIVIFSLSFMLIGRLESDPVVSEVVEGGAAQQAGFQAGDVVLAIDGEKIDLFNEVIMMVAPNPGREMVFTIRRDGQELQIPVVPQRQERTDRFGNKSDVGMIGIVNNMQEASGRTVQYPPVKAVGLAVYQTWYIVRTTLSFVWDLFAGHQSADQLGGPLRIAKVSGEVATAGFSALINLTAVLSVSIGLLNLFPIPLLDGGHLLYYAIEAVRGRPLPEQAQEVGFRIGLSMVLALMVFATWNDFSKIFL
ncbi:MAG: RIP metalloprotease RseP [Nitratireductor sp.]|nr:RIP metalloprotease RseP [Nitratireductor sp.]